MGEQDSKIEKDVVGEMQKIARVVKADKLKHQAVKVIRSADIRRIINDIISETANASDKNLLSELAEHRVKLTAVHGANEQLNVQIGMLKEELHNREGELSSLRAETGQYRTEADRLQETKAELQQRLESVDASREQSREALQQMQQDWLDKEKDYEVKLDEIEKRLESERQSAAQQQSEREQLVEELRQTRERFAQQQSESEMRIRELESALSDVENRREKARSAFESERQGYQGNIMNLRKERQALQDSLQESGESIAALSARVGSLEKELERLREDHKRAVQQSRENNLALRVQLEPIEIIEEFDYAALLERLQSLRSGLESPSGTEAGGDGLGRVVLGGIETAYNRISQSKKTFEQLMDEMDQLKTSVQRFSEIKMAVQDRENLSDRVKFIEELASQLISGS